jgi:hypothetical protein
MPGATQLAVGGPGVLSGASPGRCPWRNYWHTGLGGVTGGVALGAAALAGEGLERAERAGDAAALLTTVRASGARHTTSGALLDCIERDRAERALGAALIALEGKGLEAAGGAGRAGVPASRRDDGLRDLLGEGRMAVCSR